MNVAILENYFEFCEYRFFLVKYQERQTIQAQQIFDLTFCLAFAHFFTFLCNSCNYKLVTKYIGVHVKESVLAIKYIGTLCLHSCLCGMAIRKHLPPTSYFSSAGLYCMRYVAVLVWDCIIEQHLGGAGVTNPLLLSFLLTEIEYRNRWMYCFYIHIL